ncbi:hypothetical protein [Fimbriimonas ginsengisoli]|uniref:Uncharacterized protein n=1 Tax=Fimbriimonas ginsengisoli Gsoil 348 TaxID=661478 RepID=A0A068NXG1_FIMGI|nr:hypothetical protein [Fimbriimonas ginsengisoli]AIE88022.1 hypothetical protein OP10G_4654 [Fimbriimonas ginsengisoli Gsoil 348]
MRPPLGPPPGRTTFDSRPGDHDEPLHKRIADSVQEVVNACKYAEPDDVPYLNRLIHQRKRLVEQELSMLRMMAPVVMPPLISNLYMLDFLNEDNDLERVYVRLLEDLDLAAERIANLGERNG